jgi:peptidoglycan/LPS O-acetylase OafA/YrhL
MPRGSETGENSRFYMPELDGLRFFAFLAVFLSHLGEFTNGVHEARPAIVGLCDMLGRFGVDLFFALSAYLLTSLMIREKEEFGTLRVRAFYMRRLLRIWPLYFTWMAALILTRHLWSDYSLSFFIPWLLFAGNFQASLISINSLIILPLWSLSVEEQFYIVWPLLVRNLTRRGLVVAGSAIWILTTCARFELLLHGFTPHQIWFSGFGRLGALAAGILIAAMMRRPVARGRQMLVVLGLICWGEAGMCHLYLARPEGFAIPMWGFSMAAIGAAVFLLAAIGVKRGGPLTNPALVYMGRLSYGLYVFHGAALVVARHIVPASSDIVFWPLFAIVAFGLTLAASVASYRWLESWFLKLKGRYEVIRSAPLIEKLAA